MRKLAIVSAAFSAAIFAANYILPQNRLWLPAGALLLVGLGLLLLRRKWLRAPVLTLMGLAAGLMCFALHAQFTTIPARALNDRTESFTAVVQSYPRQYEDYDSAELLLRVEGFPALGTVVYDRSGALAQARPGDTVSGSARLHQADLRYGESYDRYNARNIYLTATMEPEGFKLTPVDRPGIRALAARVQHLLVERVQQIFPADCSAYFQSLMLGDKSGLYKDDAMYTAMSRAGFMHIVAVSGMHVAVLVSFLQMILGIGRRSSVLSLILVWCFVLITGGSPSAIRAAFMQTLLLLAPLLRRENDPPTSLFTALALILAVNPCAAASVSLQLSFAAMAGLLITGDFFLLRIGSYDRDSWQARLTRYVTGTLASSVGVLLFSVPLVALHFGTVCLLSPVANVLALWTVPICFGGGYAACLLSGIWLPLGRAAGWLLAWPARFLLLVARGVSALDFSVLYTKNKANILWLYLVYLLALVAWRSRWPKGRRVAVPALMAAVMLLLSQIGCVLYFRGGAGFVTVLDVGQGQSVAVLSGDKTVLVDCGSIHSLTNAGEVAAQYLRSRGRNKIDLLMLTHLHADHCSGVLRLLENLPVTTILMPVDPNDEDGQLEPILLAAQRHGTEVRFIAEDENLPIGNIQMHLFAPGTAGDANERCLTAAISIGDFDLLVTGDIDKAAERELLAEHDLRDMELLIAGHHGSRYACSGELLSAIGAETAVVSVGGNNFGHPTNETLERLAAYGYNVYRTDLNGDVEFTIPREYLWQREAEKRITS